MSRVPVLDYQPPDGYGFDVEIYGGAALREKAATQPPRIERMSFYVLLYATRGGYAHMIDFAEHRCAPGSLLCVQPGQVHRFGDLSRFFGWFLLFRSDVLTPVAGHLELPSFVTFPPSDRPALEETLRRLHEDTQRPATPERAAMVSATLHAFLWRVAASTPAEHEARPVQRSVVERFRRYRAAVDREHRRWHTVRRYARHLGCSEKSLARATREVADMSAKQVLCARIALEAKRLLAHTSLPISTISDDLGFSEPTNFVKFFKREAGVTPSAFRRAHPRHGPPAG